MAAALSARRERAGQFNCTVQGNVKKEPLVLTLSSLEALALYHTIYADTLYKHTATHKTLIHAQTTIALYLLSFLLPTQITLFLLILSHRLQLALRHLLLVDIDRHIR